MKTKLLLPALLAVAVVSSGCVVVPRPAYGATYGYSNYNTYGYGYGYGPGYGYYSRPGVYVSRPGPVVVRPGYNYGRTYRGAPSNFHAARPVGRGHR